MTVSGWILSRMRSFWDKSSEENRNTHFLIRKFFSDWWVGNVARMVEEREVYRVLVGKPEGKKPLGRPRHRWVDNIRTDLQEVGCGYIDWIELAQDRDRWRTLVSAVMNLRVPWNAGNFVTSCKPVSFSRRTLHHGVSKYKTGRRRWFKSMESLVCSMVQ